MSTTPMLSLIIPAYNEARSIGRTLQAVRSYLDRNGTAYELLVIADGDDGTRELVAALAAQDPRLRVGGTAERRGKGCAVREGVLQSRGTIIGFVDADYKTPIEELDKVLPWFDRGYDLVIGSRSADGARIEVPQRWYRRLGSRLFGAGMHLVIGLWGIQDTQCGFKFFRRDVALSLFGRQRIDGYMFDVEILHLAQRSRYRVKEVGVRWQDDGDSRLCLVSGNWRNFVDILRIRFGSYPPAPAVGKGSAQRRVAPVGRSAA
jgi:glycosyltransferase involved in cell wall biosynthesis